MVPFRSIFWIKISSRSRRGVPGGAGSGEQNSIPMGRQLAGSCCLQSYVFFRGVDGMRIHVEKIADLALVEGGAFAQ